MTATETPTGETIDTRDLIERMEELQEHQEITQEAHDAGKEPDDDDRFTDEERDELAELETLESAGISDWQYGETLIREDYFTEYAKQLAEDIGAIDPNANWPLSCIDWDQATEELKADYTVVEYQGDTYYVRA